MSDETKWTPGPWVVQGFRIYGPPDERSKHGNGRSLVGGVVDDGVDWRSTTLGEEPDARGEFYAETTANARLIAAAPDLYAATSSLLKWLGSGGHDIECDRMDPERDDEPGPLPPCTCGYSADLAAAKAALARARGES